MYLSDAKINDRLIVAGFVDGKVKARLFDMGLKVGDRLTVFAVAPFGTPIGIKFDNVRIAVAKSTAKSIAVSYD